MYYTIVHIAYALLFHWVLRTKKRSQIPNFRQVYILTVVIKRLLFLLLFIIILIILFGKEGHKMAVTSTDGYTY